MELKTDTYDYQLNSHFGVFFPFDFVANVERMVRADPRWAGLTSEDSEVIINGHVISFGVNSDIKGESSLGMVFADDMTETGPCADSLSGAYINSEPSEKIKIEKTNPKAIDAVTEFHTFLVREFKKKKLPLDEVYCGWRTVACTYLPEDESEMSSSEEAPVAKKPLSPKGSPKPLSPKASPSPRANISHSSEIQSPGRRGTPRSDGKK